jgi:ankyrin repeat protein
MTDREGRTALHYAALEDRADDVRQLLAAGADPNAVDRRGQTPLHFAAQQAAIASAQVLLQGGARVDLSDADGNTALWRAAFGFQGGDPALIRLLLEAGADPQAKNKAGRSPHDVALTFDRPGIRTVFPE